MENNMFKGSKVMCDSCPNENEECCKFLYDKICCFVYFLNEVGMIYIPNGSTGLAVQESIYNILRHYSKNKKDYEGEDMNIPKPCEIVAQVLPKYLEEANKQTTL